MLDSLLDSLIDILLDVDTCNGAYKRRLKGVLGSTIAVILIVFEQSSAQCCSRFALSCAVQTGVNLIAACVQIFNLANHFLAHPLRCVRAWQIQFSGIDLGCYRRSNGGFVFWASNGILRQHAAKYLIAPAQGPLGAVDRVACFWALRNARQHRELGNGQLLQRLTIVGDRCCLCAIGPFAKWHQVDVKL